MKPVPYPPEIKARGWSFDLDVERIEASDSWALAGNELQPWLLKTWYVAWKSQPVGSMPADPRLFAARIGMPWGQFQDAAEVLMRGWTEHADGLLYHPTITEKVNEMIDRRVKDRLKTQKYRERLMPKDHEGETIASPGTCHDVTSDTPGTNHGVPGEQQVSSTPTPTPSPTEREQGKPATRSTGKQLTFAKWAEAERFAGRSLIADWQPLQRYMASTGLPDDLVMLAWEKFKDRYTEDLNYCGKRYIDWRATFMNALRDNWFKLWFVSGDGSYSLTTVGQQAQREQAAEVVA